MSAFANSPDFAPSRLRFAGRPPFPGARLSVVISFPATALHFVANLFAQPHLTVRPALLKRQHAQIERGGVCGETEKRSRWVLESNHGIVAAPFFSLSP